ncbi:LytR/AlgR family response regulator transcription factor [Amycolatopsis panacis]|uniref:DNA-binding response regulator n=1 Tax=Amycolatopsis panacis TaxID=2340917 RepID=A0A419IAD6_9PSEU|nr:LytTR family DNA-binding domain-containing protein [Amycolatopsis panacis]RJQ90001.1 DNA-binding response regulator [Amycolatopsis panacis]
MSGLRVLAVDDLPPALDELCRMLSDAPEVDAVVGAGDALKALKLLQADQFDAVFLDISMPGLDGLELASLLAKLSEPPVIVFVTAHDGHAVTAYGIGAVDYLLKPVRTERLAAALAKVVRLAPSSLPGPAPDAMAALPIDSGGRTRYVRRDDVLFAEAHGDYVWLHTRTGVYPVRMPISRLEEYWEGTGFTRVHRGYLLAVRAVLELRSDTTGGLLAHTEAGDVPVSRRHARELRDRLLEAAQRGQLGTR